MTFLDGTTVLQKRTLTGGKASFTIPMLYAGSHRLHVNYVPDANFKASHSAVLVEKIKPSNSKPEILAQSSPLAKE